MSLKAVELAFQVRKYPAFSGMKDPPAAVFASVTRRMRDPKVGSVKTEFAGPKAGGGYGLAFGSVPL